MNGFIPKPSPVVRGSPDRAEGMTEGLPSRTGRGDIAVRENGAVRRPEPNKLLASALVSRRKFLAVAAAAALLPSDNRGASDEGEYIDAHVHVYPTETPRYPLRAGARREQLPVPSFTPEELVAHAAPCGVRRFVLIQYSFYGVDNSYILDVRKQQPNVFAVVGRIGEQDKPRETIRDLARRGMRGLRIAGSGRDPDRWLRDESLSAVWRIAGEEGIVVCPLINPLFLPAVAALCRKFSDTQVVIDHFGRIGADGELRRTDLDVLCGLAKHPRVRVKVSAFWALGKKEPPHLELAAMIRRLLETFGADRLMWGSDAPYQVCGKNTYRDSVELLRSRLDFLTPNDRRCLFRSTAESTFFG